MCSSTSGATDGQTLPPTFAEIRAPATPPSSSICFDQPAVDDRHRPNPVASQLRLASAEKPRDFVERPLRCRESDALRRRRDKRFESLERQRQMRAALRPGDRMDLVDDHRAHALNIPRPRTLVSMMFSDSGVVIRCAATCAASARARTPACRPFAPRPESPETSCPPPRTARAARPAAARDSAGCRC